MAGETNITVVGNLTSDPEFRFTPNGAAVVNFTIASTPRSYNRDSGQWEDGEALFLRASAWRDMAENISETLKKGMRVIASGRLKSSSYTTKDGEQRQSMQIDIDEIGPSLRYATASVTKRSGGSSSGGQGFNNSAAASSQQTPAPQNNFGSSAQANAAADPWRAPAPSTNSQDQGGWDSVPNDEDPPF
ncbi:MAG: single-stranded DNA-binding protein [Micrococcaceae bacterium]